MRKLAVTLALMSALLCATPPAASAQEDGVVVDPDSPAGKEYAIPLERERARSASSPDEAGGGGGSGRFGEGISSEGGANKRSNGTSGDSKKDDAEDRDGDAETAAPGAGGDSGGGGSGGGSDGGTDGSAALLTGGILLAVLLIGGAVALMNRRAATDI